MAVHSYSVLKERFAETRSLHRHDAEQQGLGCAQQALARQGALYIQRHCLQESFGVPEWYHEALLAEAIASI